MIIAHEYNGTGSSALHGEILLISCKHHYNAGVTELVYEADLKSAAIKHAGSSPVSSTIRVKNSCNQLIASAAGI